MTPRRSLVLIAAISLAGGLAACGDDDSSSGDAATTDVPGGSLPAGGATTSDVTATPSEPSPSSSAPTAESTDAPATSAAGTVAQESEAVCAAIDDVAAFNREVGDPPDDASFEGQKEWLVAQLGGLEERYVAVLDEAPDEISPDVETFHQYLAETAAAVEDVSSEEEGERLFNDTPAEVATARDNIQAFGQEECGVDVFE